MMQEMSVDKLPLEVQFRLHTIRQEIDRISSLEKAKELLYRSFEQQFLYYHLVKELLREDLRQEWKRLTEEPKLDE